jgi:hypothetical protein
MHNMNVEGVDKVHDVLAGPGREFGLTQKRRRSMSGKNQAVFGIYSTYSGVESGVETLKVAGFRATDVSVLVPENLGSKDMAVEKGTKAPEGVTIGAICGAVVGGGLAWLVAAGVLPVPNLGLLIAAGPVVAVLAGIGAAGAIGVIVGALVGRGFPEYEARRYTGRVRRGGILLSVHCDNSDWAKRAGEVLKLTGAQDISSAGEASADYAGSDKPLPRMVTGGGVRR